MDLFVANLINSGLFFGFRAAFATALYSEFTQHKRDLDFVMTIPKFTQHYKMFTTGINKGKGFDWKILHTFKSRMFEEKFCNTF